MKISVVMTGRSYHQADSLPHELTLADGATIDDAVNSIRQYLRDPSSLPTSCLLAVSGRHIGTVGDHAECELRDGDELTLIAPVAGG